MLRRKKTYPERERRREKYVANRRPIVYIYEMCEKSSQVRRCEKKEDSQDNDNNSVANSKQ